MKVSKKLAVLSSLGVLPPELQREVELVAAADPVVRHWLRQAAPDAADPLPEVTAFARAVAAEVLQDTFVTLPPTTVRDLPGGRWAYKLTVPNQMAASTDQPIKLDIPCATPVFERQVVRVAQWADAVPGGVVAVRAARLQPDGEPVWFAAPLKVELMAARTRSGRAFRVAEIPLADVLPNYEKGENIVIYVTPWPPADVGGE